jgi:hypothetical protein
MRATVNKPIENTPLSRDMLIQLATTNLPYFQKLWENAKTNEMYNKGESWTSKEISDIELQGRNAYSVALVASKLNIIKGEQKKNKTMWRVEAASDPNDEVKSALATLRLKDIAKQNNWNYVKNEVFDIGIGVAPTPVHICIEKDNDYNDVIKLKKLDYRDVIWDSNAKDYERNESVFWAVSQKVYRYQLEKDYDMSLVDTLNPGQEFLFGRDKLDYFITFNKQGKRDLDIINKITHYHKVIRDYHLVIFQGEVVHEARSKKEAEEYLKMLLMPYLESPFPEPPPYSIVKAPREKVDKYVYTYSQILEYEELEYDKVPISMYSCFTLYNESWTMTDLLKDSQKFLDRLLAQIDYSFGVDVKNGYTIDVNKLDKSENPDTVLDKIRSGDLIKVQGSQAIEPIQSAGANPQWQGMMGIMQSVIEDIGGGRSFQGLQEGNAESGRAILAKQQQGELMTSLFSHNLTRFDKDLGEKILMCEQYNSNAEYTMKVHGGALDERVVALLQEEMIYQPSPINEGTGYIKMNQPGNLTSWLNNARFELTVTYEVLTESEREKKLNELLMLEQLRPGLIPTEIFLEYMDMDWSLKRKIIETIEQQQQQQAQMQDRQLKTEDAYLGLEQQKVNVDKAKVLQLTQKENAIKKRT